jgi:hypothetical protein
MSSGKKKRPISPAETARRKEAAAKQAAAKLEQDHLNPGQAKSGAGLAAPKNQMFRHQGR